MTNLYRETYQIQIAFLFDETRRLLERAGSLSNDVYHAVSGYSHESIHDTFVHLIGASQLWRHVIADRVPVFSKPEETADRAALSTLFRIEQEEWHKLIATLGDSRLLETIERQSPFGMLTLPIWQTLQHVVLHGITHLTEIARMLSMAGQSPGDVDFLLYRPAP